MRGSHSCCRSPSAHLHPHGPDALRHLLQPGFPGRDLSARQGRKGHVESAAVLCQPSQILPNQRKLAVKLNLGSSDVLTWADERYHQFVVAYLSSRQITTPGIRLAIEHLFVAGEGHIISDLYTRNIMRSRSEGTISNIPGYVRLGFFRCEADRTFDQLRYAGAESV